MSNSDRRTFLKLIGSGALVSALPLSIKRALAIPANNRTGTIKDIEHIVQYVANKADKDKNGDIVSFTHTTHHTRHDLPYHFALADAFTICDAYQCSLMGPTDPNHYQL